MNRDQGGSNPHGNTTYQHYKFTMAKLLVVIKRERKSEEQMMVNHQIKNYDNVVALKDEVVNNFSQCNNIWNAEIRNSTQQTRLKLY